MYSAYKILLLPRKRIFWEHNFLIASNLVYSEYKILFLPWIWRILSTKFSYCLKFGVFWAQHSLIASNLVYSEYNILLLPRIWCILSTTFSYCLEFGVFWVQHSLIASNLVYSEYKILLLPHLSLVSSDNVRFTTVPLKALSDQVWIRFQCFCFYKLFDFTCCISAKVTCTHFLFISSNGEIHRK